MSDNKLVEGFETSVTLDEPEEVRSIFLAQYFGLEEYFSHVHLPIIQVAASANEGGFIVNSYGGYSKKGYAPYNPKKKNQDALIMAEDPKTRSLLFCVMDGHGEDGDKVSQNIKSKFANYLFKHRDFATDIQAALTDVIARCETEVLRGTHSPNAHTACQTITNGIFFLLFSCRHDHRDGFLWHHFHLRHHS